MMRDDAKQGINGANPPHGSMGVAPSDDGSVASYIYLNKSKTFVCSGPSTVLNSTFTKPTQQAAASCTGMPPIGRTTPHE